MIKQKTPENSEKSPKKTLKICRWASLGEWGGGSGLAGHEEGFANFFDDRGFWLTLPIGHAWL